MKYILYLLLLLVFILKIKKKEHFCINIDDDRCKFKKVILPIEKSFTLPEIKIYGETWSKDIYNLLFNQNYEIVSNAIENNINLQNYLLNVCYINNSKTIDGILTILNDILKKKYELKESNLDIVKKEDTVREYFIKLRKLRYRIFNKFFDEQNLIDGFLVNIKYEIINISVLKFNITYLLLEEANSYYINTNLRYGVYLYLNEKNIFEIKKDYHNEFYQYLILSIVDVLKRYINFIFNSKYDNFENISIRKIRNLIINNSIIDYNFIKKDLCYI